MVFQIDQHSSMAKIILPQNGDQNFDRNKKLEIQIIKSLPRLYSQRRSFLILGSVHVGAKYGQKIVSD